MQNSGDVQARFFDEPGRFFGSSQHSAVSNQQKSSPQVTQRGRKEILVNSGNQKWPGMKSIAIMMSGIIGTMPGYRMVRSPARGERRKEVIDVSNGD